MEINHQDEITLHNIVTDQVENAYYFGAFIFLVLLPSSRMRRRDGA